MAKDMQNRLITILLLCFTVSTVIAQENAQIKVEYTDHVNTGDLPEFFAESSVEDCIANLNDWD